MAARRGNTALAGNAECWEVDRLRAGETRPFLSLYLSFGGGGPKRAFFAIFLHLTSYYNYKIGGGPKTAISRQLAPLSCLAHRLRIAWGHGRNDTIRPARDNLSYRADQIMQPLWLEGRASFGPCRRLRCRVRLPIQSNHSTTHHIHRAGRAPGKPHWATRASLFG